MIWMGKAERVMRAMKAILGRVCRICPLCVVRRGCRGTRVSRVLSELTRGCPFCRWGARMGAEGGGARDVAGRGGRSGSM
ncbi:MAG: hypothetical protein N2595_08385 [bacterium]|nr:hypothetical protein [bacterium]